MVPTCGEHRAFLAAIAAAPDDDTPRLVFADWLDEHGRPAWAELIRVGCEASRLAGLLSKRHEDQDFCSDLSANWCPVCGDCSCPSPEEAKDDDRCPLHSPYSRHHSDESLANRLEALRVREREVFEAHAAAWVPVPPGMTLMVALVDASGRPVVSHAYARGNVKATGDLRLYFDRGFGVEWHGPLESWRGGGECGRCEGSGETACGEFYEETKPCEHCDGTGRTPGVGAAVVARHPTVRVVRTERVPLLLYDGPPGGQVWVWQSDAHPQPAGSTAVLPAAVYDRLTESDVPTGFSRGYPTREAADAALSAALIDLAGGGARTRTAG